MLYIRSANDTSWFSEAQCRTHQVVTKDDLAELTNKLGRKPTEEEIEELNKSLVLNIFYPTRGQSLTRARKICGTCPVRHHCFEYSLYAREIMGVWGGGSYRARRRIFSIKRQERSEFSEFDEEFDELDDSEEEI